MNRSGSHPTARLRSAALGLGVLCAAALAVPAAAAQTPDGAALFRHHCRACHGAEGVPSQGMLGMFPGLESLADSAFLAARSDDSLVQVLRNGAGAMRSFASKLTAEEMVAVARFIRTLARPAAAP